MDALFSERDASLPEDKFHAAGAQLAACVSQPALN
jgi:hypothetical protein